VHRRALPSPQKRRSNIHAPNARLRGGRDQAKEIAMAVIRLPEIEEIFTVLDRLEISREAVVIPLTKRDPGSVTRAATGKIEIVAPESRAVAEWLPELETELRGLIPR
jgi:hypothetical protein